MDRNYRPSAVTLLLGWDRKEKFGQPGVQSTDRDGRPEYTVSVAQVGSEGSNTYKVTTLSEPPEPLPIGQPVKIDDPSVSIWSPDEGQPQLIVRAAVVRTGK